MGIIAEAAMNQEEQERMILLLALCKLMGIPKDVMTVREALSDARIAVDRLEQATNPFGLNPPR
jgi:hypothetical protein